MPWMNISIGLWGLVNLKRIWWGVYANKLKPGRTKCVFCRNDHKLGQIKLRESKRPQMAILSPNPDHERQIAI